MAQNSRARFTGSKLSVTLLVPSLRDEMILVYGTFWRCAKNSETRCLKKKK